jgi:hypothetical protein
MAYFYIKEWVCSTCFYAVYRRVSGGKLLIAQVGSVRLAESWCEELEKTAGIPNDATIANIRLKLGGA